MLKLVTAGRKACLGAMMQIARASGMKRKMKFAEENTIACEW